MVGAGFGPAEIAGLFRIVLVKLSVNQTFFGQLQLSNQDRDGSVELDRSERSGSIG